MTDSSIPNARLRDERSPAFGAAESRLQPIFDRIARDTVEREHRRRLPFAEVGWLKAARFGALRVPVEHGGYGLDHEGYLRLLIALAAADPNVAHLWRGHFAVVEEKLSDPQPDSRRTWLDRFGRGDLVGNASTEPGEAALDRKSTRLHRGANGQPGWFVSGTKFYTTGSLFADWIDVSALRIDDVHVSALVQRHHVGVEISDDWDGFGQRLTGTGTGVFADVPVEAHAIRERGQRIPYLGAVYQTVLLATLAGIAQAIATETAAQLSVRARVYSHGNTVLAKDDPQLKQVVGELGAAAFAAKAIVLATAEPLAAAQRAVATDYETALRVAQRTEIEVNKAQIAIAEIVPRAATRLFDALGASAVREGAALDRHWRNARTILSHNPVVYRARAVGDQLVNGRPPDLIWSVGVASLASTIQPENPPTGVAA